MAIVARELWQQCVDWLTCEERTAKARALRAEVSKAFTEHPESTGETYWEHLWFTSTMSARFLSATIVIMIHGIFPFLLTKAASNQTEAIYRIMKDRIPKSRREEIDLDYHV